MISWWKIPKNPGNIVKNMCFFEEKRGFRSSNPEKSAENHWFPSGKFEKNKWNNMKNMGFFGGKPWFPFSWSSVEVQKWFKNVEKQSFSGGKLDKTVEQYHHEKTVSLKCPPLPNSETSGQTMPNQYIYILLYIIYYYILNIYISKIS